MADESPPPKKIGSLRDRIAAFEKQSTTSNPSSNPPPIRPKPGNVSWKPKQPSPPPSPSNKDKERDSPARSSMSSSDAKESIGQGISLKERMAALQGKGGFGPATPPPKPTTEKPKWKPPPKPVNPPSPSEEKPPVDFEAVIRSPPLETDPIETPSEKTAESAEQGDVGNEVNDDPEEEERQRRAAIAARMQRLGGARIGMSPPVIAPKPPTRRFSVQKEEEAKSGVTSPPPVAEDVSKETNEPRPEGSEGLVDKSVISQKPPTSMPVPAAPRRVAPPRRKKETPKVSDELPAPSQEGENVPEAKIPLPESTSNLLADAEGEKIEGLLDVKPEPVSTMESSLPIKGESPELAKDSSLVTERSTSPTLVKPGDHDDVPEDARAPPTPKEDQPAPLLSEDQLAELVEEGQKEIEERSGVDQPEQDLEEALAEVKKDEEPPSPITTADREDEAEVLPAKPDVTEDKPEEQPEGEEDEVTRRARIAVRLANSGGFNPFAGGPPVRKPSESSIPERRTSVETPGQFKPTLHEEQEPPVQPLARRNSDSPDDTTGSPTTEAKEEDKLFDTLKRVEDNDGNIDANEEVDDEGVHRDDVDAEPVEVPPPPPFAVPPPPSLISQSAPRIQRAPGSRIPTESSDHPGEKPGPPPPLPPGRPSAAPPPPPAPTRPIPSRQKADSQESHEVASRNSEEYEEERSATSFDFPRYTDTTLIVQKDVSQQDPPEPEILADEDGDPIDPGFIPSRSPSIKAAKPSTEPPKPPREEPVIESSIEEEGEEQVRKRRLAERMAKLGGIRFGAPPPIGIHPPPKVERVADQEGKGKSREDEPEEEEEEEEQARRQRIAAKLAGMGGMRIGMVPGAIPPKPPASTRKDSTSSDWSGPKSPPLPPPPTRAPPPPAVGPDSGSMSEDDVVKVEMEESDGEEVDYHDISEELPPPIPSRIPRPPIPNPDNLRKRSVDSVSFPSQNTAPSRTVPPTPSEYVMVEEPDSISEQSTPLPPPRASRLPRARPPLPVPSNDVPDNMTMSQWELPPIPSSSLDMEPSVADLSASSWSESFDTEETPQEKTAEPSSKERRQSASQMTADQLMTIWGRVGIQVCEVAVQLFEKSKKKLIGDGTYIGFVNAVLDIVPNASVVEENASSFGYPIYVQTGSSVTKRAADIMPGDIVMLQDAKLKGHKGIQTYNQTVGEGTPVVAVVGEYEPKKSKLKAYQASQHVGHQTVETVSYRLDDLKSGSIKIFRVLES